MAKQQRVSRTRRSPLPEGAPSEELQLRLKWRPTADVRIVHSDQMLLTYKGDYFVLTLGQVEEPILPPGDSDAVARAKQEGVAWISPLIRVSIPASTMVDWKNAIARLLERLEMGEPVQEPNE